MIILFQLRSELSKPRVGERKAIFVRSLSEGLISQENESDVWDTQKRVRVGGKFSLLLQQLGGRSRPSTSGKDCHVLRPHRSD